MATKYYWTGGFCTPINILYDTREEAAQRMAEHLEAPTQHRRGMQASPLRPERVLVAFVLRLIDPSRPDSPRYISEAGADGYTTTPDANGAIRYATPQSARLAARLAYIANDVVVEEY